MPKLSVWMTRASLIHMAVGFLFGALILAQKGVPFDGRVWTLLNAHTEVLVFGWTMQLVMGVAFFVLPRFSDRDHRHGNVTLGWWSFVLINGGVITVVLAQPMRVAGLAFGGRLLILLGVVAFVALIWPRVKPSGVG